MDYKIIKNSKQLYNNYKGIINKLILYSFKVHNALLVNYL